MTALQVILGASVALNAFAAYANWRVYREQKSGPCLVLTSHSFVDDALGEVMLPAVVDARWLESPRVRYVSFREKCKRRRTDGPTPCLCCPGECRG